MHGRGLGPRDAGFDFNGPYLGPPHSCSLPDLMGQQVPPQMGVSRKPQSPGSLEYLCLPAGGQVHLVPLAQVKGQGKAGSLLYDSLSLLSETGGNSS